MTSTWDAERYESLFGYVSTYGRDLLDLLAAKPGERVVDLGCGTGELASALAARGVEVLGVDVDPSMIARARRAYPGLRFVQADGHALEVDEPVDAVFSNAALHWMARPREVLERVRAALRPGGRFVAELGGHGNVAILQGAVAEAARAAGLSPAQLADPWYFPTSAQYAILLEAAGFRVRLIEHFDRLTPLEGGPDGVLDWFRMFGAFLVVGVSEEERERVFLDAAERCRSALCREGRWYADYVRLRVHATVAS